MSARVQRRFRLSILLLALGVGVAFGLSIGWLLPIQRPTTEVDRLHPDYKADYAIVVGNAYALDGDWPVAEARLAALGERDLAAYIGGLAEQSIAEGRNLNDVRSLVGLSVALGYTSPVMDPYLPAQLPGG